MEKQVSTQTATEVTMSLSEILDLAYTHLGLDKERVSAYKRVEDDGTVYYDFTQIDMPRNPGTVAINISKLVPEGDLKERIDWIIKDAKYKAPEQAYVTWEHLDAFVNGLDDKLPWAQQVIAEFTG